MATTSTSVFRNLACLSLFVYSNTTVLELQTLLFLFFPKSVLQIRGAAYLRMRLLHRRLRYTEFMKKDLDDLQTWPV